MKVRFTPEAEQQVEAIDAWWREHRDTRELFARELADAKALVATSPKVGTIYTLMDDQQVRKVFMPKTRHHIYYTYCKDDGEVVIHAVWGAPRKHGPKL